MESVKIRTRRPIYIIGLAISGIVIVSYFFDAGEEDANRSSVIGTFIVVIAIVFTLISIVELVRRKPELTISQTGIGIRNRKVYEWNEIEAIRSFCVKEDECDDRNFLTFEFSLEAAEYRIDVSLLDKKVTDIAELILKYSNNSVLYKGHEILYKS